MGCRHEYSEPKGKDGAFTLKWDVEDRINKAVKDFCEQRGTSLSKIKKASSPTLTELDAPPLEADSTQLKRTAGPIARVLYIARAARPDVAYAVSRLARRATRWTEPCERELTRLMSHLMSTSSDRLISQVAETDMSSIHIEVATDADLAGDKFSARSTTGVFASLVGKSRGDPNKESCRVPLVWSSRMQTSVSDSTAEAELTAAHNGVKLVEPTVWFLSHSSKGPLA